VGITPIAAVKKIAVSGASVSFRTIAIGMKTLRR
jgi:hypothetical protein